MTPVRGLPLLLALVATAGCGTPSADLFVVERSGALPDARLTLVVGDGGDVECDGRKQSISSAQLLEARELARDLAPLLERGLRVEPAPGSLLRLRVTGEQGTAEFADTAAARSPALARVLRFTRTVAMQSCGRAR
jgi:hypothetical protein